jgi:hypothetical protein
MSPSELQQVETLLFRAMPDPRGFANRVVAQLLERLATESPSAHPVTLYQTPVQDRSDRVVLLAAALGACECWGVDPGCDFCAGAGSSGWTDPDDALYREYVEPAVHRAGSVRSTFTNSHPDGMAPEERTDGGHYAV